MSWNPYDGDEQFAKQQAAELYPLYMQFRREVAAIDEDICADKDLRLYHKWQCCDAHIALKKRIDDMMVWANQIHPGTDELGNFRINVLSGMWWNELGFQLENI